MTSKTEQVRHDNDTLFRTSRVGLLPFRFHSASNNNTREMAAQQRNRKAIVVRATAKYAQDECVPLHPCSVRKILDRVLKTEKTFCNRGQSTSEE